MSATTRPPAGKPSITALTIDPLEQRIVAKASWRLIPFLCLCFMAAFLDRVNVSFAKLTMLPDLGLSQTAYAAGAGIFFVGYFLFEVPSNLLLERLGARVWIARIMVTWGLLASAMTLVSGQWSFFALRFALGAAEAGFFPGVILYLTYWFPRAHRARTVSLFMVAAVLSYVVGSPLSGWLMDHPLVGMKGWQWLFLVEGVPPVVLGVVVYFYLPNGPQSARWLTPAEMAWLASRLDAERAEQERHGRLTLGQALRDPRVLLLSLVYFLSVVGAYGLDFFSPTLLARAYPELSTSALGRIAAIPPLVTIPVMILWGRSSDARGEHRWHVALPLFAFAAGLLCLSMSLPPVLVVAALSLSVAGRWCYIGPFWGLPTAMLTGTAAAAGIALVNSIGNLGGQAGPVLVGRLASPSGSLAMGLAALAVIVAVSGVLVVTLPLRSTRSLS
jgi:MFS transporter, ACS family, tartrate transporter